MQGKGLNSRRLKSSSCPIFAPNRYQMKSKQILGIVFTLVGAIGLAVGVMSIFNKGLAFGQNPWGVAIIGGIFFLTGMGLMRTVSSN